VAEKEDFSGNVSLEDLIKVFQAHGVDVEEVAIDVVADSPGHKDPDKMIKFAKGDLIDVFDADPVIYKGKAHRLARCFGVPIPELYKADQYRSK
jgi:hypothetical protein